ncbi:hypothetical protein AWZ03_014343 [Drosophila navojoa]|uniref:Uncharacterized protein n=1 Tax=Drosophila navojoa TaxID=7232 RepID=A0A484AS03_DRONA|nr:hypothetical protein AWZ03_014343 [Drosophila navojoa]
MLFGQCAAGEQEREREQEQQQQDSCSVQLACRGSVNPCPSRQPQQQPVLPELQQPAIQHTLQAPRHPGTQAVMSQLGGAATRPRNWTLRGAVLLLALQLLQTPSALQHTEEGLELLFRER